MTDNQRNARTLIVCFSIAYLVLIPLRMVEIGRDRVENNVGEMSVLGEQTRVELPDAELSGLELPYREIEAEELKSDSCLDEVEARELLGDYVEYLGEENLTETQIDEVLDQIRNVQKEICR